jgi:hypothetical protein
VCNPKPPGLRPELLSTSQVSLSNDTLAVVEGAAATSVRFYDTAQGRPVGEAYQHTCAVQQIALSQVGGWLQGSHMHCPGWCWQDGLEGRGPAPCMLAGP